MTLVFRPGSGFPVISITGENCSLNCKFCRGRFIKSMIQAETPVKLREVVDKLVSRGVKGVLISGGFNHEGYLPIEQFLSVLKYLKEEHDLTICLHSGIVPPKLVEEISTIGIDVIDYEFTLDQQYLREIRGLDKNVEAYLETLITMLQYGLNVVPHIPIGFTENHSVIVDAVDELSRLKVSVVVLILNVFSHNTSLKTMLLEVLKLAKERYHGEISLGCMRPYWLKRELDSKIINDGLVDRIANPITEHDMVVEACCSIPRDMISRFVRVRDTESS